MNGALAPKDPLVAYGAAPSMQAIPPGASPPVAVGVHAEIESRLRVLHVREFCTPTSSAKGGLTA